MTTSSFWNTQTGYPELSSFFMIVAMRLLVLGIGCFSAHTRMDVNTSFNSQTMSF
jgi:hypothetical protein